MLPADRKCGAVLCKDQWIVYTPYRWTPSGADLCLGPFYRVPWSKPDALRRQLEQTAAAEPAWVEYAWPKGPSAIAKFCGFRSERGFGREVVGAASAWDGSRWQSQIGFVNESGKPEHFVQGSEPGASLDEVVAWFYAQLRRRRPPQMAALIDELPE
jgi:hypothetical protein